MRLFLSLILAFTLCMTTTGHCKVTVYGVNLSGESGAIYLLLDRDQKEMISPARFFEYPDTVLLIQSYRSELLAYYVEYFGEGNTDLQYGEGSNRGYYRRSKSKGSDWVSCPPNRLPGSVYYNPIEVKDIPLDYDSILYVYFLPSPCSGNCYDGYGTKYGFCDSYTGFFKDSLPNGKGTYFSCDTTFQCDTWRNGKLEGEATIEAKGYREVSNFKDGVRHGKSLIKIHPQKTLKFQYRNGLKHGVQVQQAPPEDGGPVGRTCCCYNNGVRVRCRDMGIKSGCSDDD